MRTKLIIALMAWLFVQTEMLYGQASDAPDLSLYVWVADERIPDEAARNLETRLQGLLAENGCLNMDYADRFVLTAKMDVVSKSIVPSTPSRISQKIELTVMVGDVVENRLFGSRTIPLSGIGTTETKALIKAFTQINAHKNELAQMWQQAKGEIQTYYSNRCTELIQRATTLSAMQKYDEAIHYLLSVPGFCADCFSQCQSLAVAVYTEKIDHEAEVLLNQAKTVWMKQPDMEGARSVALLINAIHPQSSLWNQVEQLREEVADKLREDERREWELQQKKYEDSQAFKRSIVEACRAVGVAWGQGQPQNVVKTIVRGWLW